MLDPRSLASRRDEILASCRKRGVRVDVDASIALQEKVSALATRLNQANQLRNDHQKAGHRKLDESERRAHAEEGRKLKESVAAIEARLREAERSLESALLEFPNLLHPDVPVGGEDDYRVVVDCTPPRPGFAPLDHLALCARHDLVDFERAANVAGQKFYYLKNEAALLELALQRFSIDVLVEEGFTPIVTPDLAKAGIVSGLGYNPRGDESQIYSIAGHDLCLVGTAEITLGGMYADHIFAEEDLPLRLAGISHCFRTEAGAHGRESKGLYRVHQFTKTEMFVFCRPEDSEAQHADLLRIERRLFDALEIPYRVIEVASGDLGAPAYRKYDLEAWMPGRGESGEFGEITSTSNCTDFQARRLRIRFRRKDGRKNESVHTLNGTAISNARAIIALLETHQRADGSIGVPALLQPYMGRQSIG